MEAESDRTEGQAARLPLSVFVIAQNEAARLPRTLAAARFAAELLVVDSGSTDDTVALAEAAGARVVHHDWAGYGPQKAFAEGLCAHDWVLNLDADEVVTGALAAEIARLFAEGPPPPAAYEIAILNVYPGDSRPRPWAADYRVVRLYHRSIGSYRRHALFDRVELAEGVRPARLAAPIWHYPLTSWAQFVEKENRYSSFQAREARERPRWLLLLRLVVELPMAFLKFYLLRRHVTGGWKGFAFALTAGFARWLRVVKLLERQGLERGVKENPEKSDDRMKHGP
ncbi:glycosyltransferase family 2 protein [Paralimibaculum aggregatum]|uniref:Glycosyltransferase family 2 protein n=1 Tax=Paralimibaculum aggregatum TaxID=3036245 RepID=A0ABQ6LR65_9RHOB|nr:glycosyltransferase family 2 protein [Limibaculum sp. NKW23]GMG83903.1 glycosyltransferase family 2 protein [Limibaculum sp. NKW23]